MISMEATAGLVELNILNEHGHTDTVAMTPEGAAEIGRALVASAVDALRMARVPA